MIKTEVLPLQQALDEALSEGNLKYLTREWVTIVERLPFEDYELSMAKAQIMCSFSLACKAGGWKYFMVTASLIDEYLSIKTEESEDTRKLALIKAYLLAFVAADVKHNHAKP